MNGADAFRQMWPLLQRNRPISYCSNLAQIVKSVKAAILLSQMIYWTRKGVEVKENDGWFHKQTEHWTLETGLTRHEQDTARKLLVQLGMLEVKHKIGEGKKKHGELLFRLNLAKIGNALADLIGRQIEAMNPLNLDDLQGNSEVVRQLLGKHVSYHRALVDITGSATSALLLSKMIYLQQRAFARDGGEWFSVTVEFYRQELGMNRRQQESARKKLVQLDLILESLVEDDIRHNRRLYQHVNVPALTPGLLRAVNTLPTPAQSAASGRTTSATSKTGNLTVSPHAQNRQPEIDDGCRKCTRSVAGNVLGRLPETSLYTTELTTGLELQERTTTTTTTNVDQASTRLSKESVPVVVVSQIERPNPETPDDLSALFIPKGITGQVRKEFEKWLRRALPHRRQLLIDEFEYHRRRRSIGNPVGYLRELVQRDNAEGGELALEGAHHVAKSREAESRRQAEFAAQADAVSSPASQDKVRSELASIKSILRSARRVS